MNKTTTGNPNSLLDILIDKMALKNDAALAARLGMTPPVISKMRHLKTPIGPAFLINAHEETGISIAELKELAGMPAWKQFDPEKCRK